MKKKFNEIAKRTGITITSYNSNRVDFYSQEVEIKIRSLFYTDTFHDVFNVADDDHKKLILDDFESCCKTLKEDSITE